jgi:hypothetical protein
MPNLQRLEFVTRHFLDLQTIRFAPVPAAMLLGPLAAHWMPHVSPRIAWVILLSFLSCVGAFYWWSTVAIRRRYGSVRLSAEEKARMRSHPIIAALFTIMLAGSLWFRIFAPRTYGSEFCLSTFILILMLVKALDPTNLASRRIAWAIGLLILFTVVPFLSSVKGGAASISLAGAVWLSLSIFDFLLLRQTIATLSAGLPTVGAEAVMQRG